MKLIDIDPLKERIDKEVKEGKVLDGWAFFFKAYLDDAPIIDIDRPKGEWIEMYRNGFGNMICMCSKCSFHASRSRYCPNCGADMRKREDK